MSDALAALGAYAEPPSTAQLASAELAHDRAGLTTQLANALYGSALAYVMTCEYTAASTGVDTGYRHEAWRSAGADNEGVLILLHYSAMRVASDLAASDSHLPIALGVMRAAVDAADALKLLHGGMHGAQPRRPPHG